MVPCAPARCTNKQCHCFMVFSELNFFAFFSFFISWGKENSKKECFLDFSQNSNSIIHLAFPLSFSVFLSLCHSPTQTLMSTHTQMHCTCIAIFIPRFCFLCVYCGKRKNEVWTSLIVYVYIPIKSISHVVLLVFDNFAIDSNCKKSTPKETTV